MRPIHNFYEFNTGKSNYIFLTSGDIFSFTNGNTMINQFRGNAKDGSANNIYLRIYKNDQTIIYPLLGIQSNSTLKKGKNTLVYNGHVEGITYEVTFRCFEDLWYWDISLNGNGEFVDLLYGQDIGIGSIGGVLTNELYIGQYLGHKIFHTEERGYVICSRQNQEQGKEFPYIQQGALGIKVEHYSTDGLQFFGTSYKSTNTPAILESDLPDVNYQFEFSYIGLQTEKITLDTKKQFTFYGYFMANHPLAITNLEGTDFITNTFKTLTKEEVLVDCSKVELKHNFGKPYASSDLADEEIFQLFEKHCLEEYENDTLLSFFTNEHSHVVTKQKEILTERPHGTILTTLIDTKNVTSNLITSTNYMYGLFNGQTVIGNTSLHKFLSTPRGLLNIQKNCGQHLYVKLDGTYRLLTLPALYEMGMNYSKWYYVLPDDMLIVTAFTTAKETSVILEVSSTNKISYDFILTNQLVMGDAEYEKEIVSTTIPGGLRFIMDSNIYPGLHYDIQFPEVPFIASDDRIFFTDDIPRDETFLTISIKEQNHFQCIITGSLQDSPASAKTFYSLEKENRLYQEFYKQLNGNFNLSSTDTSMNTSLSVLNETAWWYSHNAMVHFAVPHGLEQPGGAAWGTRDVCQGPMEYFIMTQHYELAKNILLNIFSHQENSSGEWPQWFMFDRYQMDAGECHGDVVFWPLKCISDYLNACDDYSILLEMLPYADNKEEPETLLQHLKRAYTAITNRFIGTTGLITYAGGDWDDTLQPADPVMKEHLVSSWTVALAYQTLLNLGEVIKVTDNDFSQQLSSSANRIKKDFSNLLIKDGVIAGFLKQEEDEFHIMIHPSDNETGIQYRLLPMTRSIIAELVDKEQAHKNMDIIDRELKCPDGVRLMNRPARYNGGVSTLFKRAEQAANVGREISLQYTHAHIRYIEACAKIGMAEEAWNGLFTINPIQIQKAVKTACRRQSNMYFSSSDGLFMDRYEYATDFHKLKEGTVPVKGGWRLYSSGPGIYLNQLISNVLGIRFAGDYLILDPVLPNELDNLSFTYSLFGKTLTLNYHIGPNGKLTAKCKGVTIPSLTVINPYREGGIKIHKKELENCFDVIDIYL
jgi:cellobiose phosphorylase